MAGIITNFFGQAMTGQGMKHVYNEMMKEANQVYILKGADGFKLREMLKKLGMFYINENYNVEFFYEPLFEQSVEAIYIKEPKKILIVQGTNPPIEPIQLGVRDKVIALYDCLDDTRIDGMKIIELTSKAEDIHERLFKTINQALIIHDDWEKETQKGMKWDGLNEQVEPFIKNIFSNMKLNKKSEVTHRLLGTLTPDGARDYVQSITSQLHQRVFIKGYPGTGKSTVMKKVAYEAIARGFDVQYVWCGLDSRAIDMVILPELSFCIFDSTMPHEYFPDKSRVGDEIFNMEQYCHLTEEIKKNLEKIISDYKSKMEKARKFAKDYADITFQKRILIDEVINEVDLEKKTEFLYRLH